MRTLTKIRKLLKTSTSNSEKKVPYKEEVDLCSKYTPSELIGEILEFMDYFAIGQL